MSQRLPHGQRPELFDGDRLGVQRVAAGGRHGVGRAALQELQGSLVDGVEVFCEAQDVQVLAIVQDRPLPGS